MGDLGRVDGFTGEQVGAAREWATFFEGLGWQALPSRPDKKAPMIPYAQFWDGGLPPVSELWRDHPSGNVQLMTGPRSVVVVDLDGASAIEMFDRWCKDRRYRIPPTWETTNNRRGSRHLWFTVPPAFRSLDWPSRRMVWGVWDSEAQSGRGGWKKRHGIEILGSRSLVMTPPSVHPDDPARVYQWVAGSTPFNVRRPAPIPTWLVTMPTMESPRADPVPTVRRTEPMVQLGRSGLALPCRPSDVIAAIGDVEHFVMSEWGLRVVVSRKLSLNGYRDCHDFNRDDNDPSARFRPRDGRFWRPELGKETWCLFRLGVEMGHYGSWRDACFDIGRRFLPHLFRSNSDGK